VARGTLKIIYSIIGKNFTGGKKKLVEALDRLNHSQINSHLALLVWSGDSTHRLPRILVEAGND
jgi:hypothetical protein